MKLARVPVVSRTSASTRRLCSLVCSLWLAACGSNDSNGSDGPGGVAFSDQHNYTSTSTLTVPVVETKEGADLKICWDGLTKDILCHDIAPTADINNVTFLQIQNLDKKQIETKLAFGQLTQAEVKIYRDYHVPAGLSPSCVNLSSLTLGTTAVNPSADYVADASKKYLLLFSKGTMLGVGARSMLFIEPSQSSTTTSVTSPTAAQTCDILDFNATLASTPLKIPANGPYKVDWSKITRDSMGNPVVFQNIDRLLVAFYANKTPADLVNAFLDIEINATSIYEIPIAVGTKSADLAQAKKRGSNEAFSGFGTAPGVWAVALTCTACQVPAPVFLAIIEPS